jgi:hypothetical protein
MLVQAQVKPSDITTSGAGPKRFAGITSHPHPLEDFFTELPQHIVYLFCRRSPEKKLPID